MAIARFDRRFEKMFVSCMVTIAVLVLAVIAAPCAMAQEKVLHSFNYKGNGGYQPTAGLVLDKAGNLYGTAYAGGEYGGGTVFELMSGAGGGFNEKILHSFNNEDMGDGFGSSGSLIFDASGNLYGTTYNGGASGKGIVFELVPQTGGRWTERVLHSFSTAGTDGEYPSGNLLMDAKGNLYGTTVWGGSGKQCAVGVTGCGTVFELSPSSNGSWVETTLHSFRNDGKDGHNPSGLSFDAHGNLYGVTGEGGSGVNCGTTGCGTVFEMFRANIGWSEKILYSFNNDGVDGQFPGPITLDMAEDSLYGTTESGGAFGLYGTVFQLTPAAAGSWKETILLNFDYPGPSGANPECGLVIDSAGNFYGTTTEGGSDEKGNAFELTRSASGDWTEIVLHSFALNNVDGYFASGNLILDSSGNLYGTTQFGGAYDDGTVFEITP